MNYGDNGKQEGFVTLHELMTLMKKLAFKNGDNKAILAETKTTFCSCYSWNLWYVDV